MTNNALFRGRLLHLEITQKCPLSCSHCYNESGAFQSHSSLNWQKVIEEAKEIGFYGLQFIGGEPFVHPDIYQLVDDALALGLEVEVYSNLAVPIRFASLDKRIKLATSFYSCQSSVHDTITGRVGSWQRTVENIQAALRANFSLRVGLVKFPNDEKVSEILTFLCNLGVSRRSIKVDRIREFGRASNLEPPSMTNLCGQCGKTAAVLSDGTVTSCPMARFISYGNINNSTLAEVVFSKQAEDIRKQLASRFTKPVAECSPTDPCIPDYCNPDVPCDPDVSCSPTTACDPQFDDCDPDYCNPDFCNPKFCSPDAN